MISNFRRNFYYLCLTLVVVLPFFKKLVPIVIVLMLVNWLIEGGFADKFRRLKRLRAFFIFTALYVLYLLGLLYTSNFKYAGLDLQIKLGILIFPLLFFSSGPLKQRELRRIKQFFIYACAAAALVCIGFAIYRYEYEMYCRAHQIVLDDYPNTNYFFTSLFSLFMHPGYFAMYLNFALIIVLYEFFKARTLAKIRSRIITLWPLLLIIPGIYFTASKINLIGLLVLLLVFTIVLIVRFKKVMSALVMLAVLASAIIYSIRNVHEIKGKYEEFMTSLHHDNPDYSSENSTEVRRIVWSETLELIGQHPLLGVGTGDVKDVLMDMYKRKGIQKAADLKLNVHNQYLQTFLTLGVIGFIMLLASIIYPAYLTIRKKKYTYMLFLLLIVINLFVESVLETQAGVVFYAFFNALLFRQEVQSSD